MEFSSDKELVFSLRTHKEKPKPKPKPKPQKKNKEKINNKFECEFVKEPRGECVGLLERKQQKSRSNDNNNGVRDEGEQAEQCSV